MMPAQYELGIYYVAGSQLARQLVNAKDFAPVSSGSNVFIWYT